MLVRRANWWIVLALAVVGPLFGALLASSLVPFDLCDAEREPAVERTESTDSAENDSIGEVTFPDGDRVALEELAPGQAKAIVVMKGPWCSVCQRQLSALSKQSHDIQMADGAVYGLAAAPPSKTRKLTDELGLDFPVLSDPGGKLAKKLNMWMDRKDLAMPGVIFLDEDGEIAQIRKGRYPGHPQESYILNKLQKLD